MKPLNKNFVKGKDQILKDLNNKYIPPSFMCFHLKKPLLKLKTKETPDCSPLKENPIVETESPEKEILSIKEQVMKLDEPRKKAFYRYYRWKNSLANEKNVKHEMCMKILMEHNTEY